MTLIRIDTLVAPPNTRASEWQIAESDPARQFGASFKPVIKASPDLRRVLKLPRRPVPDQAMSEALIIHITRKYHRANRDCKCASKGRRCITTLRRAQAWALYEISKVRGLIGSIGVGHGKTLLGLLTPFALGLQPTDVCVLLCPPGNVGEIIDEYELAGEHFRMPSLTIHGKNYTRRQPGTPALHVMPYSRLSRPEATAWISRVNPAAIIADETDKLRNPATATTARVLRQFVQHPETRFCCWTGSLTDSSLEDYAHLAALALREGSPLPLKPIVVQDWGRAINPCQDFPAPAGALMDLCEPGEHILQGYARRFRETPGVITTTEAAISTPLVISKRQAPPIPGVVQDALSELRNTMCRPDGEEFVEALEAAKCARELACGFYYRWIFPHGEPVELIERWFKARKAWAAELRGYLVARQEGLDSPKLATDAARRYWGDIESEGPEWAAEHWPRWRDLEPQVRPSTEAVRLSDYLAADAADWGLSNTGIIWYGHRELGQWISELSGLNRHGGGQNARDRILAEDGSRSIVASIKSHGRGRDGLQFRFDNQLIASPPSSATMWEQLLGRLHRTGQESGTIRAEYYAHTPEFEAAIRQALKRAEYAGTTMGSAQKILKGGMK